MMECPRCKEISLRKIGTIPTPICYDKDGKKFQDLDEYECGECKYYMTLEDHRTGEYNE